LPLIENPDAQEAKTMISPYSTALWIDLQEEDEEWEEEEEWEEDEDWEDEDEVDEDEDDDEE
jgi:hypothetical protein